MLVCPNCNFENPTINKFCEQCGTALETWLALIVRSPQTPTSEAIARDVSPTVESSSPVAESALEARNAPATAEMETLPLKPTENAPATAEMETLPLKPTENAPATAEMETLPLKPTENAPATAEMETLPLKPTENAPATAEMETLPLKPTKSSVSPLQSEEAIDPQNRYRLNAGDRQAWQDWQQSSTAEFQARVLDSQPSEPTALETFLERAASESESEARNWQALPEIALPYLSLQDSHAPAVPPLHDAWKSGNCEGILLEDRQTWTLLIERWGDEGNSLLQLLYWLDEMIKLWQALAAIGCAQSLLEETNLRLDEDQTLCLQRLYPDPTDKPLTLQHLGKMWQKLFGKSGRTIYDPLPIFLERVRQGNFTAIEAVRSNLQAIASQYQNPPVFEEESAPAPLEANNRTADAATVPFLQTSERSAVSRGGGDEAPTVVLPMQLLSVLEAGCTDIGRQREHNEDCFGITAQISKDENAMSKQVRIRGLYVVCDGMGGHAAGEVASAMAVDTLQQYFKTHWTDNGELPDKDTILEGILAANQKIYEINQQNERSGSGRMGTTLVMALVRDTKVAIAHVGDSRVYRITRKHGIEQLTTDHEVGQREIQRGVEAAVAYARPDAYQLTQAVGPRGNNFVKPDVTFLEINEDTLILLCSDGLSDNDLLETHFQAYLTPLISSKSDLDRGLQELIDFANHHNGHDNITGLLVRLKVRPSTDYPRF